MKKYNLTITPKAKNDMREISNYLARFSLDISVRYSKYINKAIQSLCTMPERCALVRDDVLREYGYRWIPAKSYIIYFTVDKNANLVRIERILHAKQEYAVIL